MPTKSKSKRMLSLDNNQLDIPAEFTVESKKRTALKVLNITRPFANAAAKATKRAKVRLSKDSQDNEATQLLQVPSDQLRVHSAGSYSHIADDEKENVYAWNSMNDLNCSSSSVFASDCENGDNSGRSKRFLQIAKAKPVHRVRSVDGLCIPVPRPLSNSIRQLSLLSISRALFEAEVVLPLGVRNVDSAPATYGDLVNCGHLAQSIVSYMRSFERRIYDSFQTEGKSGHIKPPVRAVLMDWLTQVQHHLKLNQNTFYLAVDLVDRCVHVKCISLDRFQLLGVTAVFVASKLEERYPADVEQLVYLTDNTYKYEDVIEMERYLLQALNFHLTSADPDFFLRRYAFCAGVIQNNEVLFLSQYLIDLVIPHSIWRELLPSKHAAAALCLAGEATGKVVWDETMHYYSSYGYQQLQSTMAFMACLLLNADKSCFVGAYQKYQSVSTYGNIAGKAALTYNNKRIKEHAVRNVRPITVPQ